MRLMSFILSDSYVTFELSSSPGPGSSTSAYLEKRSLQSKTFEICCLSLQTKE